MTTGNVSTETITHDNSFSGEEPRAGLRQWLGLAVLTLPVLLIAIDMTVLGFAVPHLSEDLSPTSAQMLWIVDVYGFVLAGLLITMGSLGDRIGRRRLLMIGAVGFAVASVVAAYSQSAEMLIAARVLLGVAGATLMPSTLSLLRNMFPNESQRLLAIAIWASAFSGGMAAGPLVGGWLLEHFWWGSVFLLAVPVMVVIIGVGPLVLRESRNPEPGKFDFPSVVLSLAAMLPVVYGVKKLATGDNLALALTALVAGLAVGAWFVRRQLRLPHPLIDVRLFTIRTFSASVATNLMIVFSMVAALFFLTQYLQIVLGISPFNAGLVLLPGLALSVVTSFIAVRLSRWMGLRAIILMGLTTVLAGFVALTQLPESDGAIFVAVAFGLIGVGIGLAETVTNGAILTAAPPARAGAASAISETAYELGGALGVAILGSVLSAFYRFHLPAEAPAAAKETLGGAVNASRGMEAEEGAALMDAANTAFTNGIHLTSAIGAALVVLAMIMVATTLRKKHMRPSPPPDHSQSDRPVAVLAGRE
ncbi:MFS transporter [Natronoglycomyces albus]|uniref:MFS transporter n=1 Tax=Natronoglycomyces albus TaxID=2811108 RepID=A0A895XKN8_9ACTN|nr:MFS transporter [Natronoglycomyces albus]QSB03989.1 MFS transporter [Natronoglycomyces albus]